VLPARLSALTAAMAEVLDLHQQALDLTDANARAEHLAYLQLASDYRALALRLRSTADRMIGYRDLPMARHDMEKLLAPANRDALAGLVRCELDLAALLEKWAEEDEAMLAVAKESP
jgi:hypothetical protein